MKFTFFKYHGTGNDFVLIDNRELSFPKENFCLISQICHRRFGVGADGLILLEDHAESDFEMVYFNSDGNLGSMCGNGGRCIVHFARFLGITGETTTFTAFDGIHTATVRGDWVSLKMADVDEIKISDGSVFIDSGSPHHIQMVQDLASFDVITKGKNIRNTLYGNAGANINFVEHIEGDIFSVRTYERGVEDETLSCGTGVTAVALAMFETGKTFKNTVNIQTPGGELRVYFEKKGNFYKNIYLEGPAKQVFKGIWKWAL